MKSFRILLAIGFISFTAVSFGQISSKAFPTMAWGFNQCQIFETIADHHLNERTQANVHYFLMNSYINDLDDHDRVVADHNYKPTAYTHQLMVKPGLNYNEFCKAVIAIKSENLYQQIINCEDSLQNTSTSDYTKHFSLQALVHLVGDAHQPLQIRIITNKIPKTRNDSIECAEINIPKLWDSILTDRSRLFTYQRVTLYDKVPASQIQKWQSDGVLKWLYESYLLRSELNGYLEGKGQPDANYIRRYLIINQTRMVQAGIRLAGLLNDLYKNSVRTDPYDALDFVSAPQVLSDDVTKLYGNTMMVSGHIVSYKKTDTSTILKFKYYANKIITVILKGAARQPSAEVYSKEISITGKIIKINGEPGMEILKANHITINFYWIDPIVLPTKEL